ncbi:MFS general substrate transporter [Athelia psychrophila]|uniref:MFS general substrate transporter n=1 Tax=Athelia psychrophila TaxID=1759441 RepID=A0A166NK86_9AGAM|nr:MFS general substrate transporter [Fibularhizoctonia sp. CBS 109695]
MSRTPQQLDFACLSDPILAPDSLSPRSPTRTMFMTSQPWISPVDFDERQPLLGESAPGHLARKPFYRPRPLWLVPFALIASLVRGMTVAPRVEVLTHLACGSLNSHPNELSTPSLDNYAYSSPYFSVDPAGPHHIIHFTGNASHDEQEDDDPRDLPSEHCSLDPAVQAGTARIQTILTITSGVLSALTTGWWGRFGERHGRTRVLSLTTLGLLLTDMTFILVSTPQSIFSSHGHKLLIIAPFIEGVLGGWSTLQSATTAYVSDCTSDGSRAQIFSRFTGVFYIGLSLGPIVGAQLIQHPFYLFRSITTGPDGIPHPVQSVTCVFWVAIFCSLLNFLLVVFVFPESLSKEKRAANALASAEHDVAVPEDDMRAVQDKKGMFNFGFVRAFLSPLALFLPYKETPGQQKKDWSLTYLGIALFGYMLSMVGPSPVLVEFFADDLYQGLYQMKYLYAVHIYQWSAGQLSYYISLLGGLRAIHLLFILPLIITTFKPTSKPKPSSTGGPTAKPKPTLALLAQEIRFDLIVTRLSFVMDIISHTSVALLPSPAIHATSYEQLIFVAASSLSSLSAGVMPAIQSLALCILQSRALAVTEAGGVAKEVGPGELFGALAVLQVAGAMIIGPILFGVIYGATVADFPDAIFATAAAFCLASLAFVMMIRPSPTGTADGKRRAINTESAAESSTMM